MTNTMMRWRSEDGRFAVKLVHLTAGYRFWAFERNTGADVAVGLASDGYGTLEEAIAAIKEVR